tara:strand:- start:179 stop:964 length:786 start_codon:yes stop_codon:yes gene_type:complete
MGRVIVSCLDDTDGIELSSATEACGNPHIGTDAGKLAGAKESDVIICTDLDSAVSKCDVIIDFTVPEVTMESFRYALQLNKAIVIGTTGFDEGQRKEIHNAAKKIRCVLAPNMSVGVNVLFKMGGIMAKVLGDDFDVEIVEAHHKFKKDAPSGTAVQLSEILAESLGRDLGKVGIYGRKGMSDGRDQKEIGIHTIRAGDIVGEHKVMFGGMGETLEIFHRAQSRETFARGSLVAAKWIVNQPPGIYDMQDVLGLREDDLNS